MIIKINQYSGNISKDPKYRSKEKSIFKLIENGSLNEEYPKDVNLYEKAKKFMDTIKLLEGLIENMMRIRKQNCYQNEDQAVKSSNFYSAAYKLKQKCGGINLKFFMSDLKIKKGWIQSQTITTKAWSEIKEYAIDAHNIFKLFVNTVDTIKDLKSKINSLDRNIDKIVSPEEYGDLTNYLLEDKKGNREIVIKKLKGNDLMALVLNYEENINKLMVSLGLDPYMEETITQTRKYIDEGKAIKKNDFEELRKGGSKYPLFYKINVKLTEKALKEICDSDIPSLYKQVKEYIKNI